jgi:hypothetical protein
MAIEVESLPDAEGGGRRGPPPSGLRRAFRSRTLPSRASVALSPNSSSSSKTDAATPRDDLRGVSERRAIADVAAHDDQGRPLVLRREGAEHPLQLMQSVRIVEVPTSSSSCAVGVVVIARALPLEPQPASRTATAPAAPASARKAAAGSSP